MNGRTVDYDYIRRHEKATEYGNKHMHRKGKAVPIPRAYSSNKAKPAWNAENEVKITDVLGNVKFRDTNIKKGQCGCYMVRSTFVLLAVISLMSSVAGWTCDRRRAQHEYEPSQGVWKRTSCPVLEA